MASQDTQNLHVTACSWASDGGVGNEYLVFLLLLIPVIGQDMLKITDLIRR